MSKNKLAIPRMVRFVALLKENRYPNHPMLVREMQKLDIAGAYSITQKTLQRDVAFLRGDYGAPIEYDYSQHGYYLTDPNWTWDIPQLNDSNLDSAILATHLAASIMPPPVGQQAKKTLDALLSGSELENKHADVLLTLVANGAEIPVKPAIFKEIFQGWVERRILTIEYTRGMDGESSTLSIEPHVITLYEGCWYMKIRLLYASNPIYREKEIITLALHRVSHVEITDKRFYADEAIISDVRNGKVFGFPLIPKVKMQLTGKGLHFAQEQFKLKVESQNADGVVVASIEEIEEYKIEKFIFAWAGDVCILEPEFLRKNIESHAKSVLQLHSCLQNKKSKNIERKGK